MGKETSFVLCLLFFSIFVAGASIDYADGVKVSKNYEVNCTTVLNPALMTPASKCVTSVQLTIENNRNNNVSQVIVTLPISLESASVFSSENCEIIGGQVACVVNGIPVGKERTVSYTVSRDASKEVRLASPSISAKPILALIRAPNKVRVGDVATIQLLTVSGNPIAGETVNAVTSGTVIGGTTDADGKTSFTATRSGIMEYVVPNQEYSLELTPTTLVENAPVASTPIAAAAVPEGNVSENLMQYAPIVLAAVMLAVVLAVIIAFNKRSGLGEQPSDEASNEPIEPLQPVQPIQPPAAGQPAIEAPTLPTQTPEANEDVLATTREIEKKFETRNEELERIDELLFKLRQTIPKKLPEQQEAKPAKKTRTRKKKK